MYLVSKKKRKSTPTLIKSDTKTFLESVIKKGRKLNYSEIIISMKFNHALGIGVDTFFFLTTPHCLDI